MSDRPTRETEMLRSALQRTPDCPDVEQLSAGLDRRDPRIESHVKGCAFCSSELRMLRSFDEADIPPRDMAAIKAIQARLDSRSHEIFPFRQAAEPWWKTWFAVSWARPAMVTAAAACVIAIGVELRRPRPPVLNDAVTNGPEVLRSQKTVSIVSPVGDIGQAPDAVEWKGVAGAASYRVRLLEVDGNELWRSDTSQTRATLPQEVRAKVAPSKTLLLEIAAFDRQNREIARSDAGRFRFLQPFYRP
jgi:hypothetical protein